MEGVKGLYRGFWCGVLGLFLYRGFYFGMYDAGKELLFHGKDSNIISRYFFA